MANIIIKSEERRKHEAYVLDSFKKKGCNVSRSDREAAECIAARSREVYKKLKKMEGEI
ncbi:hypothetical protein [Tepidibacter formicigenes]|jgi:hypothetical protein|uniref:Uncharacterized protein n=1 Tax=Tepidibacter formicigenes DSM 15518 TaxID=1123349 RepID=A0A1M6Q1R1_9FIRM|nr:hypothetical protein [Tepidibacter formicigenes]SHK14162.1 hypothetical protein SAMN02744037_01718 [Tepidibacter formicigenes DSM 15518]